MGAQIGSRSFSLDSLNSLGNESTASNPREELRQIFRQQRNPSVVDEEGVDGEVVMKNVANIKKKPISSGKTNNASVEIVRECSLSDLQAFAIQSNVPVIYFFHASWCSHCVKLEPILKEKINEYAGAVKLAMIDVDNFDASLLKELSFKGYPALLGSINGKIVSSCVGAPPSEALDSFLESLLDCHITHSEDSFIRIDAMLSTFSQNSHSLDQMNLMTKSILLAAGISSMNDQKRKESMSAINDILSLPSMWKIQENRPKLSDGTEIALRIIRNVINDPVSLKYRQLNEETSIFQNYFQDADSLLSLLRLAGFKPSSFPKKWICTFPPDVGRLNYMVEEIRSIEHKKRFQSLPFDGSSNSFMAKSLNSPCLENQTLQKSTISASKMVDKKSTDDDRLCFQDVSRMARQPLPPRSGKLWKSSSPDSRYNELFGGDSTVVLSGSDDNLEVKSGEKDSKKAASSRSSSSKIDIKSSKHDDLSKENKAKKRMK